MIPEGQAIDTKEAAVSVLGLFFLFSFLESMFEDKTMESWVQGAADIYMGGVGWKAIYLGSRHDMPREDARL